ncbi:hypothetical protein [uncultured Senegalimassilia sp.]|uniref:hypothetical protein n=1 Tax=uncultured Senegalimassilia sp. TaxID=1714350 RepID=UPI0026743C81|nr:hypothetical protein [uncultured Senegalimassilia sp.]
MSGAKRLTAIGLLKKMNQQMPDSLKRAAAPMIRRRLVGNAVFLGQYRALQGVAALCEEQTSIRQEKKLRELLCFAGKAVPYYTELFAAIGCDPSVDDPKGVLASIPLLTKDVLRERFDDLQAAEVGDFYEATTGGSTGAPVRVNLERDSIYREKAFIYSFWSRFGYDWKTSRLVTFRGIDFGGKIKKENPLYAEVLLNPFLLTEKTIGRYIDVIDSYGADFIQGYPSAIRNFCRLLELVGCRPERKIRCVFFISENVDEATEAYVQSVLGCPCRAFYGHSERCVFAEQVDDGLVYRFNADYGFTEICEHGDGNIVCTGYLNRRMPLIRYAVDDYATPVGGGLFHIEGHHTGEDLIGRGGERITQTALNFHDGTFDLAEGGYQLIQERPGEVECRVLSSRRLEVGELAAMSRSLAAKTRDSIVWTVVQDKPFVLTSRGKAKTVVQLIDDTKVER